MEPIRRYLLKRELPEEKGEARVIARKSTQYVLVAGELYRRGFLKPLLKCVPEAEVANILTEIHSGSCGAHFGGRSLARLVFRADYYWPTVLADAMEMMKTCEACQKHVPIIKTPSSKMTAVLKPWPFHKWGIDIQGPYPKGTRGRKYLIVACDYFTKWIEAESLATISSTQAAKFL